MRWFALLSLAFCCGCAAHFSPSRWAQSASEGVTAYPSERTLEQEGLTLVFSDPQTATIDFGMGLKLKVRSADYLHGWAKIVLKDMDGDGRNDVWFSAILLPELSPLEVIFLRRENEWERYVLPNRQ